MSMLKSGICEMSSVKCQVSIVKCQVSNVKCLFNPQDTCATNFMTRDLPVGRDGAQDPAAAGGARRVDRHGGRQQRGLLLTCFDCRGASFLRRRRLGVGKSDMARLKPQETILSGPNGQH